MEMKQHAKIVIFRSQKYQYKILKHVREFFYHILVKRMAIHFI